MKNLKKTIFAVLCAVFVTAATPGTVAGQSADAPETIVYDAESAMEVLKTLSGDWVSETSAESRTPPPAAGGPATFS